MALNGEPGWVCLMCCNCDSTLPDLHLYLPLRVWLSLTWLVIFSAVVIQWVTSRDNAGTSSTTSPGGGTRNGRSCHGGHNQEAALSSIQSYASRSIGRSSPPTPAGASLVSTANCSPPRYAEEEDDHEGSAAIGDDSMSTIARYKSSDSRAVIVTTTIRHESVPASEVDHQNHQGRHSFFDKGQGIGDVGANNTTCIGGRRRSGATVWPETTYGASQCTNVSSGHADTARRFYDGC